MTLFIVHAIEKTKKSWGNEEGNKKDRAGAVLICGEKYDSSLSRGMIEMHFIYPWKIDRQTNLNSCLARIK